MANPESLWESAQANANVTVQVDEVARNTRMQGLAGGWGFCGDQSTNVAQLVAMGFASEQAEVALAVAGGNLDLAIATLLNQN